MIRAYVRDSLPGMAVDVYLVRGGDEDGYGPRTLLRLGDGGKVDQWIEFDPAAEPPPPTFRLHHLAAQAVLQALASHYGGVDDMRALRRDYDAERARVDKLTDAVTGLAATLASPPARVNGYWPLKEDR